MNRTPPPDGADTNTRPYLIFFSYLLTCLSVAVFIVAKIFQKHAALKKSPTLHAPPSKYVWLFGTLAAGSLLSTWSFMFRYFNVSYKTWLMWRSYYELDPHHMHWGLWLKETSLFHEAWELVIVGNSRYWWSHQIFFFAVGLGLYLEQKGVRKGIRYTWAFMLLGQIVAISFATNLLFLTLLLSPPKAPRSSSSGFQHPKWYGAWLLNLGAVFATVIPAFLLANESYWHSKAFMPVLLTPHIALLVLPVVRAIVPEKYLNDGAVAFNDRMYRYMWVLTLVNAGLMLFKTTATAYNYGGFEGISSALLEHPAVSSVGFDVIFCWISWLCWYLTQKGEDSAAVRESVDRVKDTFADDGAGIAIKGSGMDGSVRRRQ